METDLLISLIPIGVLLLFSALFSGSETALTAASRPGMQELARQGDQRAAAVNRLLDNKERMIGAILLGNNLVNILASALATGIMIALFGDRGIVYATGTMTLLVLIFAEVLPKTYAINNADSVARAIAPVLRPFVYMLAPVTHAIQIVVGGTLRLFGARIEAQLGLSTTPEELRGVINLHRGPEPEIRDERAMLRSILELDHVEVGEIMTHRSNTGMIDLDKNTGTNVQAVLSSPFTRLPVYRGDLDDIVGVIHAKDLLRAFQKAKGEMSKLEIEKIASAPWFIPESTSLLDQLRAFRDRREHFAIVVDEYGSFMGVVTLEDILEEIVGEITDEHDHVVPGVNLPGVRPQPNGSYVVNGDVTIRDLNREFEWDLPDDEAATVAGLVMHEARRIPEVKQVFAFHGFRFEILRRDQNRITSVRVSRLDATGVDPGVVEPK